MRKLIGFYNGAVSGTDATEAFVVPYTDTNEMIYDHISDWAYDQHEQWVDGNGIDDDEGPDFHFEDYDPETHDSLKSGDWGDIFDFLLRSE